MMSFVVNSVGGVPDGAETVGTSPALAETVGSDPAADELADVVDGVSDEFIEVAPKIARPAKAKTRADARTRRRFFMGCTLSFSFCSSCIRLAVLAWRILSRAVIGGK
jgi:hypothetical protein